MRAAGRLFFPRLPLPSSPLVRFLATKPRSVRSRTLSNPGVNLSQFRALFDPSSPAAARVRSRRLRWDWHLRNFLIALIPPTTLYLFLKWATYQFGGEEQIYGQIFVTDDQRLPDQTTPSAQPKRNTPSFLGDAQEIEERLAKLETQLEQMQNPPLTRTEENKPIQEGTPPSQTTPHRMDDLMRARSLARGISRTCSS